MQQILVLHGGTSFDTNEDYLSFIATRELTVEKLKSSFNWKATLAEDLGAEFEVLCPRMPNSTNARYVEWKLWFERCAELVDDGVILIGESLGGIFLAKYLAEHNFPKKIEATFLVAAPFDDVSTVESLKDFALPPSLENLSKQGGTIHLLYSEDDPVVPFGELAKYKEALPQAQEMIFADRGHFTQKNFPELIELLRAV